MADDALDVGVTPDAETPVVNQQRKLATPGVSPDREPTTGETFGAMFEYNNIVGSLVASKSLREGLFGTTRTPISDDDLNKRIKEDGLDEYVNRFLDVTSKEQYEAHRADILRELEDKKIIAASPWTTTLAAGAAAGFLDLPTLIPVGRAIQLGKAADEAFSVLRTAVDLAVPAAIDAAVTEAALHTTQQTRTAQESVENIGGSILFTAAVGTGIARLVHTRTATDIGNRLKTEIADINSGKMLERHDTTVDNILRTIEEENGVKPTVRDEPETIVSAAMRTKDGEVVTGLDHTSAMFDLAKARGVSYEQAIDLLDNPSGGFVTSTGRFVDREEASRIAIAAEQIKQEGIKNVFTSKKTGKTTYLLGAQDDIKGLTGEKSPETQTGGGGGKPPTNGGGQKALPPPEREPLPPAPTNPNDVATLDPGTREKIGRAGDWTATGRNMSAEESQVAKDFGFTRAIKKVNDWLGGNIVLNMRGSRFQTARDFIANLTPSPVMLKGNFDGVNSPQSARAMTARLEGIKNTSTRDFINSYKKFRKGPDLLGKDLARYSRLVSMALANEDKAPSWMSLNDRAGIAGAYERTVGIAEGTHSREISSSEREAIEAGAKALRTYFTEVAEYNIRAGLMRRFNPDAEYNKDLPGTIVENTPGKKVAVADKEKGGDVGDLARDPTKLGTYADPMAFTDPNSYLKHIFTDRIMHDEAEFVRLEARAWIGKWEQTNKRSFGQLNKRDQRTLYNRAAKHAQGSFRAIVHGFDSEGQIAGGNIRNMGNRRGSVLDRNVALSSKEMLKRGWIEDDALRLMDVSFRQNVTDAALAMRFRREPTVKEINAALRNDHEAYWIDGEDPTTVPDLEMSVAKARLQKEGEEVYRAAKTDDERSQVKAELELMNSHIDDAVNIVRGRYIPQIQFTAGARRLAFLRDFVFATRLNNFLTSSLPDIGTVVAEHGLGRIAGFAAKRTASNLKDFTSGLTGRSLQRMRRDARAAAVAGEHENMGRIAAMVDVSDPYSGFASASPMVRGVKNMTHYAAKVQGIPYWNSWLQRTSYGIYQDRVIQAALYRDKLDATEKSWLAHHGVNDDEFLDAVKANYLKQDPNLSFVDGLHYADPSTWDIHTQERFMAAARDVARQAVITPEALEKPLAMHKPGGATLLQFMAYTIVSTHRISSGALTRIANGTKKDMAQVGLGLATMMAGAAMGIQLRAWATGATLPDWDDHKGWWTWEVMDRAGIFGMFSAIDNMVESTGFPGARRALQVGMGDVDRRTGTTARSIARSVAETIQGPAAPTINDFGDIFRDVGRSAARTLGDDQIPYNQGIGASTVRKAINSTPIANAALFRALGITDAAEQFIDENILGVPYDRK